MEKLIYLLEKPEKATVSDFSQSLRENLVAQLREGGACRITLNIADQNDILERESPGRLLGPWQSVSAVVAFWHDYADEAVERFAKPFSAIAKRADAYLVTESVPQPFVPEWEGGTRRPGITQVGANGAAQGISEKDFYRNWKIHSDSSFDLHPLRWSYVRNAVVRRLTEDAPDYRCIVLEHFHTLEDFCVDERYFGSEKAVATMIEEVAGFCDFENLFSLGMSEYYFS